MIDGTIFDIKRFAIHDGPGIRTTIFLKGCPLRCAWCHNPESQRFGTEILHRGERVQELGHRMSVDAVVSAIERDTAFYDESGGGVTFSGGEPLSQFEYLRALLERCLSRDIHRTVDISGYAERSKLLEIANLTDLVLFDIKHTDSAKHHRYTGVELAGILDNLRALCDTRVDIEIRYPVVPGINDSAPEMNELYSFINSLSRRIPLRFLPYHRGAVDKHLRFGMTPSMPNALEPTMEQMEGLRSMAKHHGLEVRE